MLVDVESNDTIVTSFPADLRLPSSPNSPLTDVASAIKQEYRVSVRQKLLLCRNWEHVTSREDGSIYVLEVGRSIEFDWTWEGAIAYRPGLRATSPDAEVALGMFNEDDMYWCGEVVEVDAARGRIFVSLSDPVQKPTTGTFFVRPFEFLALLNDVYNGSVYGKIRSILAARLSACEGGIHPRVEGATSRGLPELESLWDRSWGILWGPPGTGKTYNIGQQVARCLDDPSERILILSTTNKATDGAAIQIGEACATLGHSAVSEGRIRRIGKGVNLKALTEKGLTDLIIGTETDLLYQAGELKEQLDRATAPEVKADLRDRLKKLTRRIKDVSRHTFLAAGIDAVVCTAFKASTMLWNREFVEMIENGRAPFTTVIVDEAGLISRGALAVLSLLASKRVLLAGDPKQLAPISRMSRILPTREARWLASSGLSHLRDVVETDSTPGLHLLTTQYRMHPEICRVVSQYQYGGRLKTAGEVMRRTSSQPPSLDNQPRAIWYVLDEDVESLPSIRAERGPGNRSWIRRGTHDILKKLFREPRIREADGLYIAPFVAQAKDITTLLAEQKCLSWVSSTVHSQQGAEADIVIFDTVNANSTSWPIQEWLRLVNVALSRAREHVIVIASRSEMESPFLRPLLGTLKPKILRVTGNQGQWIEVTQGSEPSPLPTHQGDPAKIGFQIIQRKLQRPVLSSEQQRLCGFKIDGKPRLVRGVAGSGKTLVLANWVNKTLDRLEKQYDSKIWVVFANQALPKLIMDMIEDAWHNEKVEKPFPWERVELCHIRSLLDLLRPQVGLPRMAPTDYDYDKASVEYLRCMKATPIEPLCHALFVDEGQDLGESTLELLTNLVRHGDPEDPKSRSIHFFYDNAQNIYGQSLPKWSEMGIDMRGRSSVMKESFRSTRPVTELALNVLHRLHPEEGSSPDHKELVERHLVEKQERAGIPWWSVRFAQIDGPRPIFRKFADEDTHYTAIGDQLIRWIRDEDVNPSDICIIYMNESSRKKLEGKVKPRLERIGASLEVIVRQAPIPGPRSVLATTPHSYKGYDAEIVLIPSVEGFRTKEGKTLPQTLYVAMTRARSLLALFGTSSDAKGKREILQSIEECIDALMERPETERASCDSDEFQDLLQLVGGHHEKWLKNIWESHRVIQEPMLDFDGSILCEPLFWYEQNGSRYACFCKGRPPSQRIRHALEDSSVTIVEPH